MRIFIAGFLIGGIIVTIFLVIQNLLSYAAILAARKEELDKKINRDTIHFDNKKEEEVQYGISRR